MSADTIDRIISRLTIKWIFIGVALILLVAVIGFINANYLYNYLNGPFELTTEEILAIDDIENQREIWITVTGDQSINVGLQTGNDFGRGLVRVSRNYPALVIEDHLLLIQTGPDLESLLPMTWTGELKPLPSTISGLVQEYPELKDRILPFMVDSMVESYHERGDIGLLVGGIVLVYGVWILFRSMRWWSNANSNPIMKRLSHLGTPEQIVTQINNELKQPDVQKVHALAITQNYLLHLTSTSLQAIRHQDVIWGYPETTRRMSFRLISMSSNKSHALVLLDRDGNRIAVPGEGNQIWDMIKSIRKRVPWVNFEHTAELQIHWDRDHDSFIREVEQKKKEWENQQRNKEAT